MGSKFVEVEQQAGFCWFMTDQYTLCCIFVLRWSHVAQSGFDDFELLLIFPLPLPLLDLDLLGLQACTTMSVCSVCGVGTGMRTLCMLGKDFVNYSTSPVSRNNFNSSLACFFFVYLQKEFWYPDSIFMISFCWWPQVYITCTRFSSFLYWRGERWSLCVHLMPHKRGLWLVTQPESCGEGGIDYYKGVEQASFSIRDGWVTIVQGLGGHVERNLK